MPPSLWIRGLILVVILSIPLAGGPARADDTPDASVIVQLHSGVTIDGIETEDGVTVTDEDTGASIYRVAVPAGVNPAAAVSSLQATTGVVSAEVDQAVQLADVQQSSKGFYEATLTASQYGSQNGLQVIQAPRAQRVVQGQGEIVAVVDTGVTATHPALIGHLLPGYNVIDPGSAPADISSAVDSDGDGQLDDALGHGTAVTGVIAAVAPAAQIMPIKVLDSEGWGDVFNVVEGIRYAVDHGARILNLSIGLTSYSPALASALAYAAAHDAVIVAAAGNTGTSVPMYPAGDRHVLTVAAIDSAEHLAPFSAYGPFVAVCAPGVSIISPYYDGGYAVWSGTSMAAAFVSGEAALVRARNPEDDRGDILERIRQSVVPIDSLNPLYAGELGAGLINVQSATADD